LSAFSLRGPFWSPLGADKNLACSRLLLAFFLSCFHDTPPSFSTLQEVFDTWEPDIMRWFIEHGADVETDNPLAYALCNRIKTALGFLKTYKDRFPSFQDQANIALRHHCKDGNLKWVSLMLWAGADPYARGPDSWYEDPDPESDRNALELAAAYRHFDVFDLKQVRLDPSKPELKELLFEVCYASGSTATLKR